MTPILDAAQYLADGYQRVYGEAIDSLRIHKLLYLAQRESFALIGEPLFSEEMQGWKKGPVSPLVQRQIKKGSDFSASSPDSEAAYLLDNILLEYGNIDSLELVDLTHR